MSILDSNVVCQTVGNDLTHDILCSKLNDEIKKLGYAKAEAIFVIIAAYIIKNGAKYTPTIETTKISGGPVIAAEPAPNSFLTSPEVLEILCEYKKVPGAEWNSIYSRWRDQLISINPKLPDNVWRGIGSALSIKIL